jgi:hypothetical protein
MSRPRIIYLKWLPSAKAITAPPFGIFIRSKYKGVKTILIHEVTHWRQYLRMGLLKFYFNYFIESLKFRYNQMPMEKEAEARERTYLKLREKIKRKA